VEYHKGKSFPKFFETMTGIAEKIRVSSMAVCG
jgi:hypothetical protein